MAKLDIAKACAIPLSMTTRRTFLLTYSAAIAAPAIVSSQSADLYTALDDLPQLHSLLVKRGDDLVFAEAPRGPGLERFANIKSCSKSLVALILGEMIAEGQIRSIEATLGETAAGLLPAAATPGVADITMEDLVTLRAGLERTSGANYGSWVNSRNWLAYALTRPMVAQPGTRMLYSTGSTHILGAAMAEAAQKTLLQLAREHLGRPMGIEIPPWTRDPQGYYLGGNEMALRPADMLKIAEMVRDNGQYRGERVISADWIAASARPRAGSPWSGLAYGYGWFLSPSGYMLARGFGGQIIAAHKERDLAVAITSDPTLPARSDGHFGDLMRLLDGPILALG